MALHTTNYTDTFVEIADDCPVQKAEIPVVKNGQKTVAFMQFELIAPHPYRYTSDELIFELYTRKNQIPAQRREEEEAHFFSKGQACLRASPLGKRYGWGIHYNSEGKIALYAIESEEYKSMASDTTLKHLKAMRSKKNR